MDHHCPWLGNCVGAHNFKPFLLFCVYQAITGMIYFKALVNLTLDAPEDFTLTIIGSFCFYMTNIFGMLISVALVPLSLRILFQIYNNITTIEMMINKQLRYPFYGLNNVAELPNEYDMLWLNNFKQVLGPYLWLWPIPISFEARPMKLPEVPEAVSQSELDIQSYINKAKIKYNGCTFVLRKSSGD